MVIKLDQPLENMKIGIYGSRHHLFKEILHDFAVQYQIVMRVEDINESFDVVFGSGIYEFISEKYFRLPTYGVILFHESPLPEGRGNAPLHWAIKNKRRNLTITAFQATAEMDAGNYAYQCNVPITPQDTLDILEAKRSEGIQICCAEILREMKQGVLVLRPQSGMASVNPPRSALDSELDPDRTLRDLWDDIRICDNERFPAFFYIDDWKIILRYELSSK